MQDNLEDDNDDGDDDDDDDDDDEDENVAGDDLEDDVAEDEVEGDDVAEDEVEDDDDVEEGEDDDVEDSLQCVGTLQCGHTVCETSQMTCKRMLWLVQTIQFLCVYVQIYCSNINSHFL